MSDLQPRPPVTPDTGHAALRAGDADRERVAEIVRDAAGDGRLTLGELDERLDATFAARTFGELQRITADLPATAGALSLHPPPRFERMAAVFGSEKRTGHWEVPERIEARAVFGAVEIDLTHGVARHAELLVEANVVFGEVTIIVPEGVAVRLDPGTTAFGERKSSAPEPGGPPTLTVRVRGSVVFGELTVRPPKQRRRWLG